MRRQVIKKSGLIILLFVFAISAVSCCCMSETAEANETATTCSQHAAMAGEGSSSDQPSDMNACACKAAITVQKEGVISDSLLVTSQVNLPKLSNQSIKKKAQCSSCQFLETGQVLEHSPPIYLQDSSFLI